MAVGRYSRVDGRKSSNCCRTVTIFSIVVTCLIGGWMIVSSSVDPEENVGVLTKDAKTRKGRENFSKEFEDNAGDLSEVDSKGNVDQDNGRHASDFNRQVNEIPVKEIENSGELGQKEEVEKAKSDEDEKITPDEERQIEISDLEDKEAERLHNAGEGKQEPEERTDDSKAADDAEGRSGTDESSFDTKEKIKETEMLDEVDSQDQKPLDRDESDHSNEGSSTETSEIVDLTETLDEANTKSGALSAQSADSEKPKASENSSLSKDSKGYKWKLCNVTAGPDYIPCLDNIRAIRKLPSTGHYEHRERHCPEEAPTCLVSVPEGYKTSVKWPKSREKIWFGNVPHVKLAEDKGHQNWVHVSGEYLTFPGGGTQFTHGALRYIDFIQKIVSDIAWGKRTRVVLDVGCGVASFGGYLFDRDVITMSLAPKDEHEAQVQFALERGIPAISAVMGTKRLPFPSMAFDIVHCARCRVPWHIEGGKLLLELNRVLRPGGYFVWSATPVYRKDPEDVGIWKAMSRLTKSMCWELLGIGKDKVNGVSAAVYRKPTSNDCYEGRTKNDPPLCQESDNPDAAWDVPLKACMHKLPTDPSERGSQLPAKWPARSEKPPYWLQHSEVGAYGKVAAKDFVDDNKHWNHLVTNSYLNGIGIDWSSVRNVMDMSAKYGGFAAALKGLKVWVMNVIPVDSSDTLPIIYERGFIGVYHDWCQSFNTYPRTYDLLHADNLFSDLRKRCKFVAVMAEVDRILRPEGRLIVKDDAETVAEVEAMAKSLHWKIRFTFTKDNEGLIFVQKTRWRPSAVETITWAIA